MSVYELVCFWVGAFTLAVSGLVTLAIFGDWALDRVIRSLKLYREVLTFFWERAKSRLEKRDGGPS